MTSSQRSHAKIAAVALLVVGLGTAAWYIKPELAWRVLLADAGMAVMWLVVFQSERSADSSSSKIARRRLLALCAMFAGLLLAVALAVQLLDATDLLSGEWIKRGPGILTGLVLVGIGNAIPKVLGPLTARRCSPGDAQAVQRFAGWTFVIAGLAYAALWVFADIRQAGAVAIPMAAGAVILVIARCTWTMASARDSPPT